MSENQLERYVQGLKSFGKAFWISMAITASTGIGSGFVKNEKVKLYVNSATVASSIFGLGALYKNRKKIKDCLSMNITNEEIKNKYGLTGNTYFLKI